MLNDRAGDAWRRRVIDVSMALADEYELKRMPMAEQIRKDAHECNGYNGSGKTRRSESPKQESRTQEPIGGKRTGRAVGKSSQDMYTVEQIDQMLEVMQLTYDNAVIP